MLADETSTSIAPANIVKAAKNQVNRTSPFM